MAIPCGIFLEIVLVVFLGRVEVLERKEFHFEWHGVLALFCIEHLFNNSTVGRVGVIDPCAILRAAVVALLIVACRVDRHEVELHKEV